MLIVIVVSCAPNFVVQSIIQPRFIGDPLPPLWQSTSGSYAGDASMLAAV